MNRRGKIEAKGATLVVEAGCGSVWIVEECQEEWTRLHSLNNDLVVRQRRQIQRFTKIYAELGHAYLTDEQFKREGRFPDGNGTKIDVYAFKPFKWRLYGIVVDVDGRPAFLGLCIDPEKKQDKADRSLLNKVGREGIALLAALEEKNDGKAGAAKSRSNRGRRGSGH